jgi:hypothetical protein
MLAIGWAQMLEVGLLTSGKATLAMVLISLLTQDTDRLRLQIVDTGGQPAISRDDVRFALRLAVDRGIRYNYEYVRPNPRSFSDGRRRLVESLPGELLAICDDDVVFSSSWASALMEAAGRQPGWGLLAPVCVNSRVPAGVFEGDVHFTPGGLLRQDARLRTALLGYYGETADLLDRREARDKAWEVAALTELVVASGGRLVHLPEVVTYHLDYDSPIDFSATEERVVAFSRRAARAALAKAGDK